VRKMHFRNYDELYRDIAKWERQLPQFDAVCGVPRSGLIPATYIATRRNIRMVELSRLLDDSKGIITRSPLRAVNPIMRHARPYGNRLLIVDDTSSGQSVTFTDLRERLADAKDLDITYACVYRESEKSKVDLYYEEIPQPRMFGWNWFRHWNLRASMLDMDGVLCEDWKHRPEQAVDPEFVDHVKNAKPLFIPDVPVQAVVTSRIERYRELTEIWLKKHGVEYNQLIMHPAVTPELRRKMGDHAERKAKAYARGFNSKATRLFVESDERQARKIAEFTQKPVLCTDLMKMF
jgi:orotate phosphoribosyltransferase